MTIFEEKKKTVTLLTNNFEFTVEDISEIYRLRWAIISFMEASNKIWDDVQAKYAPNAPPEVSFFD